MTSEIGLARLQCDLYPITSRDESLAGQVDVDGLDLGVVLQGVFTELSTDTRVLESSEGDLGVELVVAVDPGN
jgi:hypothetical protein